MGGRGINFRIWGREMLRRRSSSKKGSFGMD